MDVASQQNTKCPTCAFGRLGHKKLAYLLHCIAQPYGIWCVVISIKECFSHTKQDHCDLFLVHISHNLWSGLAIFDEKIHLLNMVFHILKIDRCDLYFNI